MFDIGFSEMLVIAVVALIVIGPERLPGVARTIGTLLGRAQRYFNDVKSEVNRELQLEDIRKMQQDLADKAKAFEQSAQTDMSAVEQAVESAQASLTIPQETFVPHTEVASPGKAATNAEVGPGA